MNALVQRFSVQRYLTPAEMKNLAELTGLTYKQVRVGSTTCAGNTNVMDVHFLSSSPSLRFIGEDLVSEPKNEAKEASERH